MKQLRSAVHAAFRFVVKIDGVAYAAFTECTPPTVEWELQEVKEGGLNTTVHQLPGRRKASKVTLKNGVGARELMTWCIQSMNETFERRDVSIELLHHDENGTLQPALTWQISRAWPCKFEGPQFKSDDTAVAIQTLELACGAVSVES